MMLNFHSKKLRALIGLARVRWLTSGAISDSGLGSLGCLAGAWLVDFGALSVLAAADSVATLACLGFGSQGGLESVDLGFACCFVGEDWADLLV